MSRSAMKFNKQPRKNNGSMCFLFGQQCFVIFFLYKLFNAIVKTWLEVRFDLEKKKLRYLNETKALR